MKQQDFFKGASVLAFAGLITKFIGALYRIPLTNIVGAEAIGMYQLVFSVYALFLTSSTGGLPTALSKLIAETRASGGSEKEIGRISGSALGLVGITGLVFTALLMIFSRQIAAFQGNAQIYSAYIVIAPAIFFVSIISVMRGWFQGQINMTPTALSQIIEQLFKLGAGLTLSAIMVKKGLINGAIGALLGVVISEFIAAGYLYILFLKHGGKLEVARSYKELTKDFKRVAKYALPITIGGVLMPLTQFIDSFLVVNLLNKIGFALNLSTSLYGILTGPVSSLINFPVVITISLAVVIIPVVSRKKAERNISEILSKSNFAVKTALFIGIPAAILFIVFSEEIVALLYPNFDAYETANAARLLMLSSVGIVFLAVMQIFTALLQALDKIILPIRNMALAMLIKIILNLTLIPAIGIYGAAVATVAAYFTAAALDYISLSRHIGFSKKTLFAVLKTLTAGAIAAGFIFLTKSVIQNPYLKLFVTAALALILYTLLTVFTGLFTDDELRSLPLGKFLLKLKGAA
ncbi:MAG: polysaccharide biosynthesis protein [Clostridiales bacterium]|nr:polysaccharide biosynthesis protein [Clostridiales bacterium]